MSETRTRADGTAQRSQASVGELMGDVSRDLSALMRQELELAKAEAREEAKQAGKAGGMFGVVALAGFLTILFLSYALWWGLSNVMDQGWAALIVAVIWGLIGAVLFTQARKRLRSMGGLLPRTQQTARSIPDAARGR